MRKFLGARRERGEGKRKIHVEVYVVQYNQTSSHFPFFELHQPLINIPKTFPSRRSKILPLIQLRIIQIMIIQVMMIQVMMIQLRIIQVMMIQVMKVMMIQAQMVEARILSIFLKITEWRWRGDMV